MPGELGRVLVTGGSSGVATSSSTAVARRAASFAALFRSCWGRSTQNSSPPMRAAVSTVRIERRSDMATWISTRSPAA